MCLNHSVVSGSYNPRDCSWLHSSVHRILQARILEWVAISFPRRSSQQDLPNPGIKARSPALQVDSWPSEPPVKQKYCYFLWVLLFPCILMTFNLLPVLKNFLHWSPPHGLPSLLIRIPTRKMKILAKKKKKKKRSWALNHFQPTSCLGKNHNLSQGQFSTGKSACFKQMGFTEETVWVQNDHISFFSNTINEC